MLFPPCGSRSRRWPSTTAAFAVRDWSAGSCSSRSQDFNNKGGLDRQHSLLVLLTPPQYLRHVPRSMLGAKGLSLVTGDPVPLADRGTLCVCPCWTDTVSTSLNLNVSLR